MRVPAPSSTITTSATLPGGLSVIPPSPVYPPPLLPQHLGLVRRSSPQSSQEDQSTLPKLNSSTGEILKGLVPNITQKLKAGKQVFLLGSSFMDFSDIFIHGNYSGTAYSDHFWGPSLVVTVIRVSVV